MSVYDCIVVGVGGVGSAATWFAAQKGWNVLGLDQFSAGHAQGSSHGRTRIIRQAYYEHPNYVPLAVEAYSLWDQIESISEKKLYQRTGLLQVGDPAGDVIRGVRRSADQHNLPVQTLASNEIVDRWPMFNIPKHHIGLFEQVAGFLKVEQCVQTLVELGKNAGATYKLDVKVNRFDNDRGETIRVVTDQNTFETRRLIVCPGAWASQLLPRISGQLRVIRKHQHWFAIEDDRFDLERGCPTFLFETDAGYFYGFPRDQQGWVKLAEHTGGETVGDPSTVSRDLDPIDLSRVEEFSHQYFNSPRGIHSEHSVCMYTMTPDEHFIVDIVDDCPQIAVACGFSGHGFKFTPVVGKYLTELIDGQSRGDMKFLDCNRFELQR